MWGGLFFTFSPNSFRVLYFTTVFIQSYFEGITGALMPISAEKESVAFGIGERI